MKVAGRVLDGALSLNPYELMKALAPLEGKDVEVTVREKPKQPPADEEVEVMA